MVMEYFIFSNKNSYDGNFLDGKPYGNGEVNFPNGNTYVGKFRYGNITGYGKITFSNGDKYEGELYNGKINGYGRLILKDNDIFEGGWSNETLTLLNDKKIICEFIDDKTNTAFINNFKDK